MSWLAENSLPIWMGGAVGLTMALVVFFQTRTNRALLGVAGVIVTTAALLLVERFLETPREAVERSLYELANTVEANNVAGTLRFLAPTVNSEVRKDVETLMPLVTIEVANVMDTPQIEMNDRGDAATVHCQGVIVAVNKRDGMKGGASDRLVMQWVRQGDRWLLESYTSQKNWNRAVGRANRKSANAK